MVSMIDTSPVPQKLSQAYGSPIGALSSDYQEGIIIKSSASASMIDTTTQITYNNITNSDSHKVAFDID